MNIRFMAYFLPLLLVSAVAQSAASGGVTVGGTRLIYNGDKKEASLSVTNSDLQPYLIQSWVEVPNGMGKKPPFVVTPPLFRLDGNQKNILRIVRTDLNFAGDRESMYWLNIKSIPTGKKQDDLNILQIAVKTRIKVIYRPEKLNGTPEDVTSKLTWSHAGNVLTVNNPTPFIMNFHQVKIGNHLVKNATFVMPMSQATFAVPSGVSGSVSWKLISDYGGVGAEHRSSN